MTTLVSWTDKQRQVNAVADAHRFTLYGGTRGPGKSFWLRWRQVAKHLGWAKAGHRGVRTMLACEDYPSLLDRQVSKIAVEFPAWLGTYNHQAHEFRFTSRCGGGAICCRNLNDPSKYQSAEFAMMSIDELTKNPKSKFDALRGSLRWPGIERTEFDAATNSTGLGVAWVRGLWIERAFPKELEPLKDEFAFVPGLPTDNPYLDQSYFDDLNTLPDTLRKAWALGDWYAGVEGLVYSDFTADNLTDDEPDATLPIELAVDDGYVDPRAILFIQRSGTHVLVFHELYHRNHLDETCVAEVVATCTEHGWPLPQIAVGSPEANQLQARFRAANIPFRYIVHQVVDGIKVVRRLIKDGHGYRALLVNRRCRNFIWEVTEGYQYAEGRHGDAEKPVDGNDHAADALRYWSFVRAKT
jgi:hypothetical protein